MRVLGRRRYRRERWHLIDERTGRVRLLSGKAVSLLCVLGSIEQPPACERLLAKVRVRRTDIRKQTVESHVQRLRRRFAGKGGGSPILLIGDGVVAKP